MIVTGGENVYSIEVENAIGSHPAVDQVAVIGIPHETWGEQVHAIVVLKTGASATAEELIKHARERIAGYKVPKSVEFRSEPIPLSGAMKPLKRELRKPYWEGRATAISYGPAPRPRRSVSATATTRGSDSARSSGTGRASDQFGQPSVVPGMFGRSRTPRASSRDAVTTTLAASASSRWAATITSSSSGVVRKPRQVPQPGPNCVDRGGVGLEAQPLLGGHVGAGPQAGDGRQVMGADRRH